VITVGASSQNGTPDRRTTPSRRSVRAALGDRLQAKPEIDAPGAGNALLANSTLYNTKPLMLRHGAHGHLAMFDDTEHGGESGGGTIASRCRRTSLTPNLVKAILRSPGVARLYNRDAGPVLTRGAVALAQSVMTGFVAQNTAHDRRRGADTIWATTAQRRRASRQSSAAQGRHLGQRTHARRRQCRREGVRRRRLRQRRSHLRRHLRSTALAAGPDRESVRPSTALRPGPSRARDRPLDRAGAGCENVVDTGSDGDNTP
jgi:hypothetical protein